MGMWDVQRGDDAPVATFEPHSRPVGGLRALPTAPHLLLSCAHDGTVRSLDLGAGTSASFTEIYRVPEESDGSCPSLHGSRLSAPAIGYEQIEPPRLSACMRTLLSCFAVAEKAELQFAAVLRAEAEPQHHWASDPLDPRAQAQRRDGAGVPRGRSRRSP